MKTLRAFTGGLDPWAALLLGVSVTLGVIILLAAPGPWHKVVDFSPPARLVSPPPTDIAVFVLGASNGDCTGIVWLHVDHERHSLTASVLAPQTQGPVRDGGYVPLNRIVDDLGVQAAATSLSAVLKVDMDTWVTLDRDALRLAVAPMFVGGQERPRLRLYTAAARAWEGRGGFKVAWPMQYETLRLALPQVPLKNLNVVAFANYVLGFGIMQKELDLQAATSLANTLKALRPSQIMVRACPAVVDTCRGAEAWAPESTALGRLRHNLAVGLMAPDSEPTVATHRREARVLVVVPDGDLAVDAYVGEVRRRLRRSSGAPVSVRVVRAVPRKLTVRVKDVLDEWRPLAVLVAPPRADGQTEAVAGALQELGLVLSRRHQPAVMSLPWGGPVGQVSGRGAADAGQLAAAIEGTGLPVSRVAPGAPQVDDAASRSKLAREAARANVETLVRACWPAILAPRLVSTHLGFSFAACQRVSVGVLAETTGSAERAAARLRLWGYEATVLPSTGWQPDLTEGAVYYRKGMQRPALALGGDVGLRRSQIVAADSAPADLALVLSD